MNIEKIYQFLDNKEPNNTNRDLLISYLKECSQSVPKDIENRKSLVYNIAGLLSTKYAMSLDENDPIDKILTLAGELETNDKDEDDGWVNLIKMINSL